MYVCVCMYVSMYGWMDGCMYVCMVPCPVSRVPESVSLGDHTMGGGQGSGVRTQYIYIYMNPYAYERGNMISYMRISMIIIIYTIRYIYIYICIYTIHYHSSTATTGLQVKGRLDVCLQQILPR